MKKQYKEPYIDLETVLSIYEVDGRINDTGFTGVKDNTHVKFECTQCGRSAEKNIWRFRSSNFQILCRQCLSKQTCLEKYGKESFTQTDSYIQKSKETCLERYGVDHYNKTEEGKEKHKQTCLERYGAITNFITPENIQKSKETCLRKYGVDHYNKTEEGKTKHIQTCLERYGIEHYTQTKECQDKMKETCMERYGVDNYAKTEEYKERCVQTCIERYGVPNYSQFHPELIFNALKESMVKKYGVEFYTQTSECKERIKNTCMEKYGVPSYFQSIESHHHRKTRIEYDGEYFDSKPEYEFYKKCIEEGKTIIRHPKRLEYLYENKTHYYFPDFEVDGVLIEIKGRHFLNPITNKWWNPFDHTQDKKFEAKYDCAIRNGVKIIYV